MICKNCGASMDDNSVFCTNCGNAVNNAPSYDDTVVVAQPATTDPGNSLGLVSLILGIASLVFAWGAGIPGLILGNMALKKSEEAGFTNGKAKTGKILSLVGIILGIASIILLVFYYVFIIIVGLAGM